MSRILKEVLAANAAYAKDFGDKAKLPIPPARRFAVLTCMDARIDPAKLAGLAEGDAHVIRNAGGRASDDAIRSLVISHKLLGTNEWFVIHHTDCGMGMFTDETIRTLLSNSLETASLGPKRLAQYRQGTGLDRRRLHRLADLQGSGRGGADRHPPHPLASAGAGRHPDLRLYLRRQERSSRRGARRQGARQSRAATWRRCEEAGTCVCQERGRSRQQSRRCHEESRCRKEGSSFEEGRRGGSAKKSGDRREIPQEGSLAGIGPLGATRAIAAPRAASWRLSGRPCRSPP